MNSFLKKEIDFLISQPLPWDSFKDKTILITGATGLIGRYLVNTFAYADFCHHLNIKIITLSRSLPKITCGFPRDRLMILQDDICQIDLAEAGIPIPAFIFHCASITKSKEITQHPVETFLTAVEGTKNLLEYVKTHKASSMVCLSSMEIYGLNATNGRQLFCEDTSITEDMLGYIDLSAPRSSYPEGKRAAESLCNAYFNEYQIPVKTARLAQTFGAGVSRTENRIFAQIAKSVISESDIVLQTSGQSDGNYCHIADTVNGLLRILLYGRDGETYNISNEALHMTIKDMASYVSKTLTDGKIQVRTESNAKPEDSFYPPDTKLLLSSLKLRNLGWTPYFTMKDMYQDMIGYWLEESAHRTA